MFVGESLKVYDGIGLGVLIVFLNGSTPLES